MRRYLKTGFSFGFSLIIIRYFTGKIGKSKPWKVFLEHSIIALVFIIITHYVGVGISITFNF